ncbi:hypothetical protein [Nocardia sp. NPDC052566]|uniref:hypothetical protein n=1 Tax=Nocardia sp. NPDC052566 TaxID=3364330 RepID=UPI0037CC7EB5
MTHPTTPEQKIEALRAILKPVIDWYEGVLAQGEPDGSYLYDATIEQFQDRLNRGDFQSIIEIVRRSE